ncbi:MAG: hypothetical protein LBB82_06420 [Treponema sp.]|jgi:uncharacterized protein (TIGR03545 family)|nr:hypothetical protein [Treponema sp.]
MAKKVPGLFTKSLIEKRFKSRLLKFIEQPDDREFLTSCYTVNEGVYTIRDDLDDKTIKKLKVLAKAIKINRKGPAKLLPIMALAVIIAGGIFFFTVMLDPLLSRFLRQGLEEVFEARCDVRGFHLGLLRFRIGIASLTVADRDEPMRNLFETGRLEIRLRPQAVLRGKVYIEELRADGLEFGTPRTVSGALPRFAARIAARKAAPPAPPLVDLAKFDAMGLLNAEYDKLQSPKAYDEAVKLYTEAKERWEAQYRSATAKVAELKTQGQALVNTRMADLKTPQEVTEFIVSVNAMIKSVESAKQEVDAIVNGVQNDVGTAQDLERKARAAFEADLAHLKDYLDLSSGSAFKALEPSIMAMLSDQAIGYINSGRRALEALEKIKALQAAIPKSEPKPELVTFKGRDVHFPTPAYPVFYLGVAASDFTLKNWNYGFELRSISSSPDISGRPAELDLSVSEQDGNRRTVRLASMADFRTGARQYFSVRVDGDHFPLDIKNRLKQVGIGGFTGDLAFSANLSGGRGGAAAGGGGLVVNRPHLSDPSGTIAELVAEVMSDFDSLSLGIQYEHPAQGDDVFTMTSNIADLLKAALERTVRMYLARAQEAIEKALRERIDQFLDGRWVSKEEVDLIFAAAKGDKGAVDSLKNALDEKKAEAENRARGALDDAKAKAEDSAKNALQNLLSGGGKEETAETANEGEEANAAENSGRRTLGGIKLPF